jgi:hypothetical protein
MSAPKNPLKATVRALHPALRRTPLPARRLSAMSRAARAEIVRAIHWNQSGNIVGFGIGPKRKMGKIGRRHHNALIVFVATKIGKQRLRRREAVPRRIYVRALGRTIATDVIEVGEIPRLQAPMLRPGVDAAHFTMRNGTLTAVVRLRNAAGPPLVLSCSHGFAPLGAGGHQIECPPDPSPSTALNEVARLQFAIPLRPGGTLVNTIDAALASPIPAKIAGITNLIPGLGTIASVSSLDSGQFRANGIVNVFGVGAMTPRVTGRIVAENVSTVLTDHLGRVFLFQNLVAYMPNPMTQPGDSGMPLFRQVGPNKLELLGMHIGLGRIGATGPGAAFFVPIASVLNKLAVDVIVNA